MRKNYLDVFKVEDVGLHLICTRVFIMNYK